MNTLGTRIADLRVAANLTQFRLAELAAISPSTIAKLETGQYSNARLSTIESICRALKIPVSIMLEDVAPVANR